MFCGDKEWTFGLIAKVCGCGYGQWMTCGVVTVDDEGDWCIFYFIFFSYIVEEYSTYLFTWLRSRV
jgi:hypothetical protein